MPWHYKHPDTFPAAFGAAIRDTAKNFDPSMLGGFVTEKEALVLAEKIRYFKYCIRQTPNHPLQDYLENYDVRTKLQFDGWAYILWLIVKPTKVSDFIDNNPELAKELLSNTSI